MDSPADSPMLQRIENALRVECRIKLADELIVAVSGGPDSLCLLHALLALGHRPIVAHFDHQLRPESSADAAHVASLASALALRFVAGSDDVAAYAASKKLSTELAGRVLRYGFLFAQARAHGAVAVAVGHTADDQVETILMHLLRGTGLSGLRGMGPRVILPEFDPSIPIVRPLLGIWRVDTVEYCRRHDLPVLHDTSNESRAYLRNRVRLDVIPSLEAYNSQIRRAVWRLGRSAAADLALLDDMVTDAWKRTIVDQGAEHIGFDASRLAAEPPALQVRLIMRAANALQPTYEPDFDELQRACGFVGELSGRRLQLGGSLELRRESTSVYLTLEETPLPSDQWPQLHGRIISLGPRSEVTAALDGRWHFTAELLADVSNPGHLSSVHDPYRGLLDADALPADLQLRAPRPGDRIQPLGLQGHTQKLSDVFINLGIPRRRAAVGPSWQPPTKSSGSRGFVSQMRIASRRTLGARCQSRFTARIRIGSIPPGGWSVARSRPRGQLP